MIPYKVSLEFMEKVQKAGSDTHKIESVVSAIYDEGGGGFDVGHEEGYSSGHDAGFAEGRRETLEEIEERKRLRNETK